VYANRLFTKSDILANSINQRFITIRIIQTWRRGDRCSSEERAANGGFAQFGWGQQYLDGRGPTEV